MKASPKLNVGCGGRLLPGWTNIDIVPGRDGRKPDIVADLRKIPLPDGHASEIMAIHVWEHFYLWECDDVIAEWRRLLKVGGLLIMEMPDLYKCCLNIVNGTDKVWKHPDQAHMWGLYGDPRYKDPFMCHRWGWSAKTLIPFLSQRGFGKVEEKPTQYHPDGRELRDMRIEATKL